jgi:transcriptional regulator of arginine metabolism
MQVSVAASRRSRRDETTKDADRRLDGHRDAGAVEYPFHIHPSPVSSPPMANKRDRQAVILELVQHRSVASQEDLRKLLVERGWDVTQSTLSRDIHELGLARVATPDGLRYQVAGGDSGAGDDDERTTLETLLPALFLKIDGVGELVVLHTVIGGAQPVAVALDAEEWTDVLGTIAGDDTILVVCRSAQAREGLIRRIRALAGR